MLLLVKTSKMVVVLVVVRIIFMTMAKRMRMSMQDDGGVDGNFDDDVK